MNKDALMLAKYLIERVREEVLIDDTEFMMIEELAAVEKKFFMDLMVKTDEYLARNNRNDLTLDEISGVFTFAFAKSAEAVTNYLNKAEQKFEFWGIFDGKVPIYTDDTLTGELKKSRIPAVMAQGFIDFVEDNDSYKANAKLALFEALKWTWRLGQNFSVSFLRLYFAENN